MDQLESLLRCSYSPSRSGEATRRSSSTSHCPCVLWTVCALSLLACTASERCDSTGTLSVSLICRTAAGTVHGHARDESVAIHPPCLLPYCSWITVLALFLFFFLVYSHRVCLPCLLVRQSLATFFHPLFSCALLLI